MGAKGRLVTSDTDKITGGCLCGEIRYESDMPPYLAGYCHCKMCQKGVGNLFASAAFFKHAHFRYVKGTPTWFTLRGAKRGFCSHCGSPLAFQRLAADYCAIWLGTLDRPDAFKPTAQWHTESKISWVDMGAELHDATPRGDSGRYDTVGID
jgi:hypothetical protein